MRLIYSKYINQTCHVGEVDYSEIRDNEMPKNLDALKQPQNEFQSPKIGLKHFSKYELYTQIGKNQA